jgi:hypothetical protein
MTEPTEADFAAYDAADARARTAYFAQDRTSSDFQPIGEFDRREFTQAIAEARAQRWQPIETAPKDGTPILLLSKAYDDDYHHPARCSIGKWWAEGTSWVDQYGTAGEAEDICELAQTGVWLSGGGWFQPNEVTHWQPLPEPFP